MRGIISWFVGNPVAANLLMAIFLAGGLASLLSIHQEEFPSIDANVVNITVPYLGAAPEEVEQAVCIRIEQALEGINDVDRITTLSAEGACITLVELAQNANGTQIMNDIKTEVDAINTFPEETENPVISMVTLEGLVARLIISGDADEATLKRLADRMRDDLALLDGISQVGVNYSRPWEISIEVSEANLRRYQLTLGQVAEAVRRSSLDLPGGSIKTAGGEILLRSKGQAQRGQEFADITLLTRPDGSRVRLGDVARVNDAFEEGFTEARFNGKPAMQISIYRVGEEDINASAAAVHSYVEALRPALPEGISLNVWVDESESLKERIGALSKNAWAGLLLVLVILTLFLKFKVAFWVAAGIPIAVLGAIWMFPAASLSISTLTVMAFILVLGIVVDDAIVVGERIYAHERHAESQMQAAVNGTMEVCVPVIFGVLTTFAAFLPILLVEGRMGNFFRPIGYTVCVCLAFSILESQLILPAHLAHRKTTGYPGEKSRLVQYWLRFQARLADTMEAFADRVFRAWLAAAVHFRYITFAFGTAVLLLTLALVISGRVVFQFFPSLEGDQVYATLSMPEGVNVALTKQAVQRLEAAAARVAEEYTEETGKPLLNNILSSTGVQASRNNGPERPTAGGSHIAEVVLDLYPLAERGNILSREVANRWRAAAGRIPDAVELTFTADAFSAGEALAFRLRGRDVEELRLAAASLRGELARFPGVQDLTDSFRGGKQEIRLGLRPEAESLGLTLNDLARQVRRAFYGEQAQRIQRGSDDVRVMVRYPEAERRSLGSLESMYIRTKDGSEVPFPGVASVSLGDGYSTITRINQERVITVTGDIDRNQVTPEEINTAFFRVIMPRLQALYPSVSYSLSGEAEQRDKAMSSLVATVPIALMVIYALLAIPLKSYFQPFVIMSVIPFGAIGAIFGHYLMGWDLVFFSLLGIIALSGVVVNASLVLVDYINRQRRAGVEVEAAAVQAGVTRFRPILLTSVTTFIGLVPLMFNTNPETFFFIPMAISLAFGVIFATIITLFLVPALYMIQHDFYEMAGIEYALASGEPEAAQT